MQCCGGAHDDHRLGPLALGLARHEVRARRLVVLVVVVVVVLLLLLLLLEVVEGLHRARARHDGRRAAAALHKRRHRGR